MSKHTEMANAYRRGRNAYAGSLSNHNNPYSSPVDEDLAEQWALGWDNAHDEAQHDPA